METTVVNGVPQGAITAISPSGSPFSWQNPEQVSVIVLISLGTVTLVQFSPDGASWYDVGLLAGMFHVNPRQWLKVSYLLAPTMYYLPG